MSTKTLIKVWISWNIWKMHTKYMKNKIKRIQYIDGYIETGQFLKNLKEKAFSNEEVQAFT